MDQREPTEWFRKATQDVNGLIRTAWPIIRASQVYVEQAQAMQAKAGPILESGAHAALAMDAGMLELMAAVREHALRRVAASANLAATPKLIVSADTAAGTESMTVTVDDGSGNAVSSQIDVMLLAVLILWLIALVLPLAETDLTSNQQQILNEYIGTVPLALIVSWRMLDKRKR
jgi:hypothetical protein